MDLQGAHALQPLILLILGLAASAVIAEQREVEVTMPGVTTSGKDSYLCTSIEVPEGESDWYAVGFRALATKETAHHILSFHCGAPGASEAVWSCGHGAEESGTFVQATLQSVEKKGSVLEGKVIKN